MVYHGSDTLMYHEKMLPIYARVYWLYRVNMGGILTWGSPVRVTHRGGRNTDRSISLTTTTTTTTDTDTTVYIKYIRTLHIHHHHHHNHRHFSTNLRNATHRY